MPNILIGLPIGHLTENTAVSNDCKYDWKPVTSEVLQRSLYLSALFIVYVNYLSLSLLRIVHNYAWMIYFHY